MRLSKPRKPACYAARLLYVMKKLPHQQGVLGKTTPFLLKAYFLLLDFGSARFIFESDCLSGYCDV